MEGRANEIPPLGTLLHLSNEETNGQRSLRAARRQGLGLQVAPPLSREVFVVISVAAGPRSNAS